TPPPRRTVECCSSDGRSMTLRLVQGEASVDVARAPKDKELEIVAGEAKLSTHAGSVVNVRRSTDHMDVDVKKGWANLWSPQVQRKLNVGDKAEGVLLHTATATNLQQPQLHLSHPPLIVASADALPLEAPPLAVAAPADENATPNQNKWKEELEHLRQQRDGVAGAINGATSSKQLMQIADIASKGGDMDAAMNAWSALRDRFPDDPLAEGASLKLADAHEKRGDIGQAQKD